jgi:hypothetical protein
MGTPSSDPPVGVWDIEEPAFTMLPKILIEPAEGKLGSAVTIRGFDFTQGSMIPAGGLTLGGVVWNDAAIALESIDTFGAFDDFVARLNVPADADFGPQQVKATDTGAFPTPKSATGTFDITPATLNVSPQGGGPGTLVTLTGENWAPGDIIGTGNSITSSGVAIGGIPPDAWNVPAYGGGQDIVIDASGSWAVTLAVPDGLAEGPNAVRVNSDGGTGINTTFSVSERMLTLTPDSGPKGTKVTIQGKDMTEDGVVQVGDLTFEGDGWNGDEIDIDSQGNLHPSTERVPADANAGPNLVVAVDDGGVASSAIFNVTQPTISIDPASGLQYDVITVTGAGWLPGFMVTIEFDNTPTVFSTPGADGTFVAQLTVPLGADVSSLIEAYDTMGNVAAAKTFMLKGAQASIEPESGEVGDIITVSGTGFPPQQQVTALGFGDNPGAPFPMIVTDTMGAFSAEVLVPGFPAGAHTISVQVGDGDPIALFFVIEEALPDIEDALASIADALVRVWGFYDGDWQLFDPADPVGSDLENMTPGRGYWVNVSEAVTLIFGGFSYDLVAGWNNIGWR